MSTITIRETITIESAIIWEHPDSGQRFDINYTATLTDNGYFDAEPELGDLNEVDQIELAEEICDQCAKQAGAIHDNHEFNPPKHSHVRGYLCTHCCEARSKEPAKEGWIVNKELDNYLCPTCATRLGKFDLSLYDETPDQWVKRIGRLGAMNCHPDEFKIEEIIDELEKSRFKQYSMTVEMAKRITTANRSLRQNLVDFKPAWLAEVINHAYKLIG